MKRHQANGGRFAIQLIAVSIVWIFSCAPTSVLAQGSTIIDLEKTKTAQGTITKGKFRVFENRKTQQGRLIDLNFVVLHAKSETPRADPFFYFVGGPGQAATTTMNGWINNWVRNDRDIVLIDQRGTAGNHNLAFEFDTEGNTLQQFLDPIMDLDTVKTNLKRLKTVADLRMYSTPIASDDVNDFRQAMGYDQINIMGGSYGTRACLVYLRRHGDTVRTATLAGCAPIAFRNPLYHAQGAQRALDMMFSEVESREHYRDALGDLREKFNEILTRLDQGPVTVEIKNQSTGKSEPVQMNRVSFLEAVRFQMYYQSGSRRLPRLLVDAHAGNFRPFVLSALQQNIGLRRSLALGMLLSVTTAEDVARINLDEIDELTGLTVFGGGRVRTQMAAAALWPISELPTDFGQPVRSNVPTLILSGLIDPVTPPEWGELIHNNLPNSVHLVIPTAHDIGGPCVDLIRKQFLANGSVKDLDIDCVSKLKLAPLNMPK